MVDQIAHSSSKYKGAVTFCAIVYQSNNALEDSYIDNMFIKKLKFCYNNQCISTVIL